MISHHADEPPKLDSETLRSELRALLDEFEQVLLSGDVRQKVLALVPAARLLRDLGISLVEGNDVSARERILAYLRAYPETVISGDEIAVVSGISEYARRVRELRVQFGWPIFSGVTTRAMLATEAWRESDAPTLDLDAIRKMRPDDYILIGGQDRDAAHRWSLANEIRRLELSMRDRILRYLRVNVGRPVTGEELRYVAKGQSWPRRTRELRTQHGWPLATRSSGRPDLPIGVYLLEADRQSPAHDRQIPDPVRVKVLERDGFACRCCSWSPPGQTGGDPRSLLELHHVEHHVAGGGNDSNNLITLCNVHHDDVHRLKIDNRAALDDWISASCA